MSQQEDAMGEPTPEARIRNRCQRACFTAPVCQPGAADACPMCRVADTFAEMLAALKSLRADVIGAIGIGISDCIGHTNTAVLGHKCQVAYAAIAKAEGKQP